MALSSGSEIDFFVPGPVQTAGSKMSLGKGRPVIESGTPESRKKKKSWRGDLRDAAGDAVEVLDGGWPLCKEAAYIVTFTILRHRPANHLKTGRNAGGVKDWAASLRPHTRPDALKVARAAEDALTGILWHDDSQIVDEHLHKVYTSGPEGIIIRVHRLY